MSYYIYENWTHRRVVIHLNSCSFCNEGRGVIPNHTNQNGQWLGSFNSYQEALQRAKNIHTTEEYLDLLNCSKCLKSKGNII